MSLNRNFSGGCRGGSGGLLYLVAILLGEAEPFMQFYFGGGQYIKGTFL